MPDLLALVRRRYYTQQTIELLEREHAVTMQRMRAELARVQADIRQAIADLGADPTDTPDEE